MESFKKKDPQIDPPVTLQELLVSIRKDKGQKVIVTGNNIPIPRRLPTGIFELDFYLGGGFPCGRYSIVYGPESSCKTNICLKAAAMAQRLPKNNKVVWVNIEQSFDPIWAAAMGVNVTELIVVNPGYGEEAVDLVDALVRAEDVALVVVDSMAGLIASKEIANSVEKADMMSSALLIKRMVNKLMVAFGEGQKVNHDPCVILINQTRFKPTLFGDPETMPGGEAQKFLSSLRIRVRATNENDKATSTLMNKEVKVIVKKAKIPVRAVDFTFTMSMVQQEHLSVGETDSFKMVKSHLQALGLLEAKQTGYFLKLGGNKAGIMFPKISDIYEKYLKDREFQLQIQALVIEQYKDNLVFVAEEDLSPKTVEPGKVQLIANGEDDVPF